MKYGITKFNKRRLYNRPVNNNKYIKTKISPHNENFYGNKKLTKREYYDHSILLLQSICEAENKHYPQTFLDEFFEIHNDINMNKLLALFGNPNKLHSLFYMTFQIIFVLLQKFLLH